MKERKFTSFTERKEQFMATPSQIAANQANAQKSTGPETEEGKAKSAMNRLTHGFASARSIIPGEDPAAFHALLDELRIEHHPASPTEEILVEKMAQTQWLTQRALNLQGEAFLELALKQESGVPKHLGLLIRYYTTADRAFHRAHNELIKAQKQRKNSEIGFEPQKAADPALKTPAETALEDFIMNEPDLDLVEQALGIQKKAA
jgi:hypothetical protein